MRAPVLRAVRGTRGDCDTFVHPVTPARGFEAAKTRPRRMVKDLLLLVSPWLMSSIPTLARTDGSLNSSGIALKTKPIWKITRLHSTRLLKLFAIRSGLFLQMPNTASAMRNACFCLGKFKMARF